MMVIYVAIGGALGASARYLLGSKITNMLGSNFPYSTMIINIIGSFLMGIFIGYLVKTLPHSLELRSFIGVGLLGGFTTFSAYSLDAVNLLEKGDFIYAAIYILGSVIISILSLIFAIFIVRSVI